MVKCVQCNRELGGEHNKEMISSISGSIMGDEYIESYFYCADCGVYAVEVCHDRFSGPEEITTRGPIPKADGNR